MSSTHKKPKAFPTQLSTLNSQHLKKVWGFSDTPLILNGDEKKVKRGSGVLRKRTSRPSPCAKKETRYN
jgi:hypothetical protein